MASSQWEVERQIHSLLKCLQIAKVEKKNWHFELVTWLTVNRSTRQATTGAIPFSLMFGRDVRSKLPDLRRGTVNPFKEEVCERDWSNKLKGERLSRQKERCCFQVYYSQKTQDSVILSEEWISLLRN